MLSYEEALTRILARAQCLPAERVALEDAAGRTLAEDLVASQPMPAFNYSAMDGYAITSSDYAGAGPFRATIIGESQTGHATPSFQAGSACRIFTGAELPAGSNAVIPQEDVRLSATGIEWTEAVPAFRHVRRMGEDLAKGAVALSQGSRLTSARLALTAALDHGVVAVNRRPRVVVLCTGDELRPAGSETRANSIPESNAISIVTLAASAGAQVRVAPLVPDDVQAAERALRDALLETDVLVTVGGASVGDHDVVRDALQRAGAELDFWKVSIRPGKPLIFGSARNTLILGLPGNPVSAQVTFTLFGLPLLRALQGSNRPMPQFLRVPLGAAIQQKPGRTGFYRAEIVDGHVFPIANQASGAPSSMASADALVMVPADSEGFPEGELVSVLLLGN